MRTFTSILISFALAGVVSAQQLPQPRREASRGPAAAAVPGRLLVQHRLGADDQAIQRSFGAQGALVERYQSPLRLSILTVDESRRGEIQKTLEDSGLFNFVEPDYYAQVTSTPNDPYYSLQWHLPAIQAPAAWNYTTGSASVKVAMIDSGVDGTHPDLVANLIPGYNFVSNNTITSDTMGHGTTTAGTLGAVGNNGNGIAGVDWQSAIMPLVVVDQTGYASYSNIASAITYAAQNGVRIVNISIGGTTSSSALQSAVNYAWSMGTVVFASAGNGGSNAPYYPAGCQYVVAVGATDSTNTWQSWSNYGTFLSVVAPGVNIYTTTEGGGYGYEAGTSYSSPIAAGVGALMLSYAPSLSASALVSTLESTATDLGTPGYDIYYGWGLVNAAGAVSAAAANQAAPPTVTLSSPTNSATVTGTVSVQGNASSTVGLASIQWFLDGTLAGSATSSPFSFSWNSTSASNATHTVTTKATDKMNNVGTASVSVVVNNPVPPPVAPALKVAITSPTANQSVGNELTIAATATDTVPVTQVSIYVDGVLDYTGTVAPYSLNLNTKKLATGAHTVYAKAWDSHGTVATSSTVQFTATR